MRKHQSALTHTRTGRQTFAFTHSKAHTHTHTHTLTESHKNHFVAMEAAHQRKLCNNNEKKCNAINSKGRKESGTPRGRGHWWGNSHSKKNDCLINLCKPKEIKIVNQLANKNKTI